MASNQETKLSEFINESEQEDVEKESTDPEGDDDHVENNRSEKSAQNHQERIDGLEDDTKDSTIADFAAVGSPKCPCYNDELQNAKHDLDDEVFEYLNIDKIRCGHAINYITNAVGATLKKNPAQGYACYLRRFVEFLEDKELTVIEAEFKHIENFFRHLAKLNRAESTISGYRSALTNLYKHITLYFDLEPSVRWDLIREEINPSSYQTPEPRERDYLDKEEVKKLYDSIDGIRNQLMIHVGLEAGPRNVDLRSIKLDEVDLDEKEIKLHNTKAGGTYTVPITDELALLLRRWINVERTSHIGSDGNDYLFPSETGGKIGSNRLRKIVDEAAQDAKIQQKEKSETPLTEREKEVLSTDQDYRHYRRVTPHTLRHTFYHLLKEAGLPMEARSEALDHESTDITKEFYDHDESNYSELMRELFSGSDLGL